MSKGKLSGYDKLPVVESTCVCQWCGQGEDEQGQFKHLNWCRELPNKIYDRFRSTFREIYNVIELSLDEGKAEIAKDLIGNTIMETRNDCTKLVADYFLKDSKL